METEQPQSIESEMCLLGSLLLDEYAIIKIAEQIQPDDFYKTTHQQIYSAILKLHNSHSKIDLFTVSNQLEELPIGKSYLVTLTNTVPTSSHAEQYAEIVKDKSLRRKLLIAQQENSRLIYGEEDINSVIAQTQDNLFQIGNFKRQDDSTEAILKDILAIQAEYKEKYSKGQNLLGYSCGLEKIDNAIDGLREGHLWVVGGFTSTGKSFFALNILDAIIKQNIPCSFFSLEMTRADLGARLIGMRNKISSAKVLKGTNELDFEWFSKAPMEIHSNDYDFDKIKAIIRKDVYLRGVKVVFLDYLQNLSSKKFRKEYELSTHAITEIRKLAQQLKITIIVLSQISNESERGNGAGAGFKGSGAIEAASDLGIKLIRNKDEDPDATMVEVKIVIVKNRHGFKGVTTYYLDLKSGVFTDELKKIEESFNSPKY